MKCADPKLCYTNPVSGKRKLRHFSLSTRFFKTLHNQVFDCGQCYFCRKKRSYELAVRCVLHASMYTHNSFLTLTYDEARPEYHNNLNYPDIQNFKKRLRAYVQYHFSKKIDVFNVHEYGKNGKKHWHLIVFNFDFTEIPDTKDSKHRTIHTKKNGLPIYTSSELEKLWPYGFNTIADVSEASAMYQSQYTQKDIKNGNQNNSKKAKSNHKGIGKPYFLRHFEQILKLGYIPFGGRKVPIPRAFQRIADKHYSHFYDQGKFFDTPDRKRLYTPFRMGEENKEIADLYKQYLIEKEKYIHELEEQWDKVISDYLETNEKPEFIKAAENALYDLHNKNTQEKF